MPSIRRRNRSASQPLDQELEYHQPGRRRRIFIILGVLLALGAGGAAFYLTTAAQQQGTGQMLTRPVIVAARDIPARTVLKTSDLTIRELPEDPSLLQAMTDPKAVVGRVTGVAVLMQQPILSNLLLSSAAGGQFSILQPGETIAPNTPNWRAVSVNVPDDRAVGGKIDAGQQVDLFVTVQINVIDPPGRNGGSSRNANGYYTDKSTKVTYQDVVVLAKNGTFYIVRVDERVAEEISHLQAAGNAVFSIALRPEGDHRTLDTSGMGQTTNRIVEEYKLPIPQVYPKP